MQPTSVEERVSPKLTPLGTVQQVVYFVLHVVAIYAIVNFTTPRISGFVREIVLPLLEQHPPVTSSFQFLFSHSFMFSVFGGRVPIRALVSS